jgi:hypothetical protein
MNMTCDDTDSKKFNFVVNKGIIRETVVEVTEKLDKT